MHTYKIYRHKNSFVIHNSDKVQEKGLHIVPIFESSSRRQRNHVTKLFQNTE